jgi:hypothetical protein
MNPEKLPKRLFYIRGIIRNRLTEKGFYYNEDSALELLADAFVAGVPLEELEDIAKSLKVKTWTNLRDSVVDATLAAEKAE